MRISGVFCHKTPLASFDKLDGKKGSCELGDLLVVHDHLGRVPLRRAALMQAKRTVGGKAQATDAVQNDLYRRLPLFELSRKGHKKTHFKRGKRNIAHAGDFARFALVADDASCCIWSDDWDDLLFWHDGDPLRRPAWVIAHPLQDPVTTIGAETFGSFLSSMLFQTHPARGQIVAPVKDLANASLGTGNDLEITVQELLDITAKRIANSQNKWGGLLRGIVAFQDGSIPVVNSGNPLPALPPLLEPWDDPPETFDETEADDGEGISILLIETFGDYERTAAPIS